MDWFKHNDENKGPANPTEKVQEKLMRLMCAEGNGGLQERRASCMGYELSCHLLHVEKNKTKTAPYLPKGRVIKRSQYFFIGGGAHKRVSE